MEMLLGNISLEILLCNICFVCLGINLLFGLSFNFVLFNKIVHYLDIHMYFW